MQKPTSMKDKMKLFFSGDISEGEYVWAWISKVRVFDTLGHFRKYAFQFCLPLYQFSTDNYCSDKFEYQQGWSVPCFTFTLDGRYGLGLRFRYFRRFLGPSKDLNTNRVWDPKTEFLVENWARDIDDPGKINFTYRIQQKGQG